MKGYMGACVDVDGAPRRITAVESGNNGWYATTEAPDPSTLDAGTIVTTYIRESRQVVDEDGVLQPADGDVAVDAYSGSASLAALEVRVADLERKTAGGCMSDDGCMCGHVCLCDGKA